MLFVKKLPWASLLLLLFTYGVFGWLISDEAQKLARADERVDGLTSLALSDISWFLWVMGAVYILLIAVALTAPFRLIQTCYTSWLKSDTRAFASVIVGAFVAVVIITWIDVFVRILVLLSAGALVRLDLQTGGYSKWQAFVILISLSLTGFGLGAIAHQFR
jgi:uncharacterized membrane protein